MSDCIFCKIVIGDARSWKVFENDSVYAFFDINPVNEYHTLVIPKSHYENIYDVPEKELVEVIKVVKELSVYYKNKLGIKNVQIINCSGREAQQDVFHMHIHIVPRYKDDRQNIIWTTHPEWKGKFDQLLAKIS